MLNRYSTIPLSDVIERTKMQLRLQNTTEHDDLLGVFILEGLRSLNNIYQLDKHQAELDIVNFRAKLPHNFVRLLALTFSSDNALAPGQCFPILYADTKFLESCGCTLEDNIMHYLPTFQINKDYISFKSNINATKCRLAYMGLNVDDDGNMLIYEDFERALMAYASWQFTLSYYEDYPMNLTMTYQRTWVNQKAWLKGAAQQEDFQRNKREIQNIMKSKLVSNLYNI